MKTIFIATAAAKNPANREKLEKGARVAILWNVKEGLWYLAKVRGLKGKKYEVTFDDGTDMEYSERYLLSGRVRKVPDFIKRYESGWTAKQLDGQINRGGRLGPGDRPAAGSEMANRRRRLASPNATLTEDEQFEKEEDAMLKKKYGVPARTVYDYKAEFEHNGLTGVLNTPGEVMNNLLTYPKNLRAEQLHAFLSKDAQGRNIAQVAAANGADPLEVKAYKAAMKVADRDFDKIAKRYEKTMDWYGYHMGHERRKKHAEAMAWRAEQQKAKRKRAASK